MDVESFDTALLRTTIGRALRRGGDFAEQLDRENLHEVALTRAGCAGLCDQEPMITLRDASGTEFRYGRLDQRKIEEIVQGHVLQGVPVRKYLITA